MSHFRAKVRYMGHYALGRRVYEFTVINQHSGQIVARDNHCGLSKLHDEAREAVEACRLAWTYDLRRKDLK